MAMSRDQRLKRRRIAARLRRQTERLEREQKPAGGEHLPHDHRPTQVGTAVVAHGLKWLPYKPAAALTDEDRARGAREGRFTAFGDLWLGPLPVPVPAT